MEKVERGLPSEKGKQEKQRRAGQAADGEGGCWGWRCVRVEGQESGAEPAVRSSRCEGVELTFWAPVMERGTR
eukprot:2132172-Rhodomonas_salina.2